MCANPVVARELKILKQYMDRVLDGLKKHEVRVSDEPFQERDVLLLKEWEEGKGFTPRWAKVRVTYVSSSATYSLIPEKMYIMSFEVLATSEDELIDFSDLV